MAPTDRPLTALVCSTSVCHQAAIQSSSQVPLSPPTSPPSALDQPDTSITDTLSTNATTATTANHPATTANAAADAAAPSTIPRRYRRAARATVAVFLLVALHSYALVDRSYAFSYATVHTPSSQLSQPAGGSFLGLTPGGTACVRVWLVYVTPFVVTAAIFPGAPPAWSMPYVHAVGFMMLAGRAHTTLERFHAVAAEYAGESDASLAVRRVGLIASFLGTAARILTDVATRGADFWYGVRLVNAFNALIILVVVGTLWWIEGPSAYPPLDNSAPEGVVLACSLAFFAATFNPKTRRRVASTVRLRGNISADVRACEVAKGVKPTRSDEAL